MMMTRGTKPGDSEMAETRKTVTVTSPMNTVIFWLAISLAIGTVVGIIVGILLPNILMDNGVIDLTTNLTLQQIIVLPVILIVSFPIYWTKAQKAMELV
jgi:hypothetical protein